MATDALIELDDVHVHFPVASNWRGKVVSFAHALNGVSFQVQAGEVFGIVGESGCGKSTLAQVLMGLIEPTSGTVVHRVKNRQRANIQIVFQDPQSSLDPRLPAWRVITEPLVTLTKTTNGKKHTRHALHAKARELAQKVGLRAEQMERYVHEFSGGQRQRIAIARALSSDPDIIVLDEPTSALDVSVQAQILNLLQDLRREHALTYILISHNVSVVRHMCDRVAVMYLGQIVEQGSVAAVLDAPAHPYTLELKSAVPRLDVAWDEHDERPPAELPGNRHLPQGCFFRSRCPWAQAGCELPQKLLPLKGRAPRQVRCHVAHEGGIRAETKSSDAIAVPHPEQQAPGASTQDGHD